MESAASDPPPGAASAAAVPWRARATADGTPTLVHPRHGEACHSASGAWLEARERYARACRLAERAAAGATCLRLLDVGTGMGLGLAAALEALAGTGTRLEAVGLELDPAVLAATLGLDWEAPGLDAGLRRWHACVRPALAVACGDPSRARAGIDFAPPGHGRLRLFLGDARATLARLEEGARFDAVFLDPFSPAVDPDLWSPAFLRAVAGRMAPGSWLSTYSAAVRVRAGLLAAGLRAGAGARVGAKSSGTLASPDLEPPALPPRLARRLERRAGVLRAIPGARQGDAGRA